MRSRMSFRRALPACAVAIGLIGSLSYAQEPRSKQSEGQTVARLAAAVETLTQELARLSEEVRTLRKENERLRQLADSRPRQPAKNSHRLPGSGKPAPERFLDRGEYVEDTTSGLLWQKDGDASGKLNFYQAKQYAENLTLGGLDEWRVPTRKELETIFPATGAPFTDTKYTPQPCCQGPHDWSSYWTSEVDTRLPDYAYVYQWYAQGGANNCIASQNFAYVRCVRVRDSE